MFHPDLSAQVATERRADMRRSIRPVTSVRRPHQPSTDPLRVRLFGGWLVGAGRRRPGRAQLGAVVPRAVSIEMVTVSPDGWPRSLPSRARRQGEEAAALETGGGLRSGVARVPPAPAAGRG